MIHTVDPRQNALFDSFAGLFSPLARKLVEQGWQGVFRHVILALLPVDALAQEFDPVLGRPTKELYSMAGLMLLMEFNDWTHEEAVHRYMFSQDVQYALNLPPSQVSLSSRTLERYLEVFRDNGVAMRVMDAVTGKLVELLELDVSQQRLDSTHVFSNMATFGRTRLMGVTIKRFLTQLKRHDAAAYVGLPAELMARYAPSEHGLFGEKTKDAESRARLRQQVAEDMYLLVERFADDAAHNGRSTYQALCRVFEEQCEVVEKKVQVKTKTGGAVMQNPSDPDATYDGHKGPGYQSQLAETCSPANEVQLITCAQPETAVASDDQALPAVIETLETSDRLPDAMLADTLYGSDANVQTCVEHDVELVAPVPGKAPDPGQFSLADFAIDETTEVVQRCPAGHAPLSSVHDPATDTTHTEMDPAACGTCSHQAQCPVHQNKKSSRLDHTSKERRIDQRRRAQNTDAFREPYKKRAGIESTNSGLKRRTGLGRLRVRGKKSVFHAIYLKVAGWNILRAAAAKKMKAIVAQRIHEKTGTVDEKTEKNAPTNPWAGKTHLQGTLRDVLSTIFHQPIVFRAHTTVRLIRAAA